MKKKNTIIIKIIVGLSRKILTFEENRKTRVLWVKQFHQNLEKFGITKEDIDNREVFSRKIAEVKDLSEENQKEILSEEERVRVNKEK